MRVQVANFNSGELTPQVDARNDVEKYAGGCRILENMIPRVYGPAERRPGTEYINTARNTPEGIRLIPFIFSADIAYMMEFGDLYARFYYNGQILQTEDMATVEPVEITTPYLVADLPALHYAQVGDVMRLVHGDYQPQTLSRTTAYSFSIDDLEFTDGPFRTRNDLYNDDGITLTYAGATAVGSSGTITASDDVFDNLHIGALFQMTHPKDTTIVELSAAGNSSAIEVDGTFTFVTHGTWTGTVKIQRKDGDNDWEDFRTYVGEDDRNIQFSYTEKESNIQYRIQAVAGMAGTFNSEITVNDTTKNSVYKITGVASAISATAEVVTSPPAVAGLVATLRWAEGSWSNYRGWPVSVTFFESRAIYVGQEDGLVTVWFSATDDFENMKAGVDDADAFVVTIPSANDPRWIDGLEALAVGTSGDEWRITSNRLESPITPTTFTVKQQTTRGSNKIQPQKVNDAIIYTDFVSRRVREFVFSDSEQKYLSPDLTSLAEHITESGITSIAYQRNPDPILWTTRADGRFPSMTYERDQNVVAWSKHLAGWTNEDSSEVDTETSTVSPGYYPILNELTASEIPAKPSAPTIADGTTPVSNATELQAMSGAGSYILTTDIDLTGVSWTPLVDFAGTLDGDGYTISNLTLDNALQEQGLIGNTLGGPQIKDLTLDNFTISQSGYNKKWRGALIGYCKNVDGMAISNCHVTNSSITGYNTLGGFIGYIDSPSAGGAAFKIFNCSVTDTDVTGGSDTGGFIGKIEPDSDDTAAFEIVDCYVSGGTLSFPSGTSTGGFVGEAEGRYWIGDAGTTTPVGSGCFHSCYSTMDISTTWGLYQAGGFGGYIDTCEITNCYSTGTLSCTGTSNVVATGGFCGLTYGCYIINSYTTSNLSLTNDNFERIGGFIGKYDADGWVNRCYATGNIAITLSRGGTITQIGGMFGGFLWNGGDPAIVERSWCTGDITITTGSYTLNDGPVGGFVGILAFGLAAQAKETIIKNCYSWSSISIGAFGSPAANSYGVGGFIGYVNGQLTLDDDFYVENCYCAQTDTRFGSGYTNQIPNESGVSGGFLGQDFAQTAYTLTVTNSFFDTETTGFETDASTATASTTDVMQTKSTYEDVGWDMDAIWNLEAVSAINYVQQEAEGQVSSVAVIPSDTEDEVWLAVLRSVGGTLVRFIERMKPRDFGDQEDAHFVDCGVVYDGVATNTITGLDHLEGELVSVWGDGADFGDFTVTGGSVTLPDTVEKASVGLPFRYKVKPMRLDTSDRRGTSHGMIKKIGRLFLSFIDSLLVQFGVEGNLYNIDWRQEENYDSPPAMFTGDKELDNFDGGFDPQDPILITGERPAPCTIRSIVVDTDYTD